MSKQAADVELREIPRRPFGVYALVVMLLIGMFSAALEIIRVQSGLSGFWAETDEFLLDLSGLVSLAGRLFTDPFLLTIVYGIIIFVWVLIIIGLWLLHRWAWLLLMIFTGVTLTFALFRYFDGDPDFISMLTNVAVVFYLNDNSVQRCYARRVRAEASA